MPEIMTNVKLRNRLGPHARDLLTDYLQELPRKKGGQQKYKVIKSLPSADEVEALRSAKFTTTVESLVADAFSEFESLAGELDDWYNNLPDSFQQGDKGQQLEEAKGNLENLSAPDVSEELGELKLVYVPSEKPASSRSARCVEACDMIRAAIDRLAEVQDDEKAATEFKQAAEELASELENAIGDAESVEFPGMY